MKKEYINPEVTIIDVLEEDIVCTSAQGTKVNDNGLLGDIDLGLEE